MTKKLAIIAAILLLAELLLILVSWIVAAAMPEVAIRSMLSEEGVRWLFGHFVSNLLTPFLAWLLLLSVAYGAVKESGIMASLRNLRRISHAPYRQRFALQVVLLEFLIAAAIVALLTLVPHAPLLSVTGSLFPSSFSQSIIPIISFCTIAFALTYGMLSGSLSSLADMFRALYAGIVSAAPLFVLYVFFVEFYYSLLFVFT